MLEIKERYAAFGSVGPDVWYTDNCCGDEKFIVEYFPHLASEDPNISYTIPHDKYMLPLNTVQVNGSSCS